MDVREIPVVDINRRQRRIPHALRLDARRLRLDLPHEVEAHLSADAVRIRLLALLRDLVRLHEFVLAVQHMRPFGACPSGDLMIRPLVHESLQRRLVARILLLSERLVLPEDQPLQIAVQQRRLVRILRMKAHQALEKPDRLERDRILVRCRRLPFQKFRRRCKDRALRRNLKRVLRLRPRLLARRVKCERLVRDEIKHRGPVAVRHSALLQQLIVIRDLDFFQLRLRRERLRELFVNLGENPRQIPCRDVFPRRLRRRRALHETVAVLLEIMPVPVREDRIHHRHHLLRRLRNLSLQARDFFLRLLPLDLSLECNLPRQRLDRLGISLLRHRLLDDRPELFDRRLRQPLALGIGDILPHRVTLARREQHAGHQEKLKQDGKRESYFHRRCRVGDRFHSGVVSPRCSTPRLGDLPAPEVVAAFMQVMEKMRSLKSRDATQWQPRTLSA